MPGLPADVYAGYGRRRNSCKREQSLPPHFPLPPFPCLSILLPFPSAGSYLLTYYRYGRGGLRPWGVIVVSKVFMSHLPLPSNQGRLSPLTPWSKFPPPPLPLLPLLLLPFLFFPLPLEVGPLIAARGSGRAL